MDRLPWLVIVNENMHDACARVAHEDSAFPLSGWDRVWSNHATREEAEAELPEAERHADGKRLP